MMLSLSFAETFPAERKYLSKMMKLISNQHSHISDEEISDITGIPTGGSTGKIRPHLKYLLGMGLIEPDENWYKLTPFGKIVESTDRMFSVDITVWTCHAFLSSPETGAILCNELNNLLCLGAHLSRSEIAEKVQNSINKQFNPDYFSPIFSTYTSSSSLGKIGIITQDDEGLFSMCSAPEGQMYIPMYGALVCHWFNTYFSDVGQVSISEFNRVSGFGRVFGKKDTEVKNIFNQLAGSGYIKISNLVNPPVFSPVKDEIDCWWNLYANMI